MNKIIGVHKENGEMTSFKLDNGNVVTKNEAIAMATENKLEGVLVGKTKNGEQTIHSVKDDNTSNNLSNLPSF